MRDVLKKGGFFFAFSKSFDRLLPSQSEQADLLRYFFCKCIKPYFRRHSSTRCTCITRRSYGNLFFIPQYHSLNLLYKFAFQYFKPLDFYQLLTLGSSFFVSSSIFFFIHMSILMYMNLYTDDEPYVFKLK